jgi:hypothetical protein
MAWMESLNFCSTCDGTVPIVPAVPITHDIPDDPLTPGFASPLIRSQAAKSETWGLNDWNVWNGLNVWNNSSDWIMMQNG